jgi:1-pyrroline-5-carboxylate dehydrogenase
VKNEPVLAYNKGSKERRTLESSLKMYAKETVEVPIVIGGVEYKTDRVMYQPMVINSNFKF